MLLFLTVLLPNYSLRDAATWWFFVAIGEQLDKGQNTKYSITHSFLELQIPDFVWNFVRTIQKKYKSPRSIKSINKYKSTHISTIFDLQPPNFALKFI